MLFLWLGTSGVLVKQVKQVKRVGIPNMYNQSPTTQIRLKGIPND